MNQIDSAKFFTHKAIDQSLNVASTYFVAAESYEVLCRIYAKTQAYTKAIEAGKKALEFAAEVKSDVALLEANHSMAQLYKDLAKYNEALVYAYQAIELAKNHEDLEKEASVYHLIQKIYKEKGDIEQAYKYQSLAYEADISFQKYLKDLADQRKDYILNKKDIRSQEKLIDTRTRFNKISSIYGTVTLILLISIALILFVFRKEPLFNRIKVSDNLFEVEQSLKVRFIRHATIVMSIVTGIALIYHIFLGGSSMEVYFALAMLAIIGLMGIIARPDRISLVFYLFGVLGYTNVTIFPLFVGPLYTGFLALITIYLALNYIAAKPIEYILNMGMLICCFIFYLSFLVKIPHIVDLDSIGVEAITALGCTISIVTVRYYTGIHSQVVRKELYKNQLFLEEISDVNPFFILSKDLDGKVTYANKSILKQLKVDKEEILGKQLTEIHAKNDQIEAFAMEKKVILNGETLFIPACKIIGEEDDLRYIDIIKKPIYDEHHEITGILMVGVDTTEKRLAQKTLEEREMILNSIINTLPDPVYVIGMNENWQIYNKAFPKYMRRIFGTDEFSLPNWIENFPTETARLWTNKLDKLLIDGNHTEHIKFPTQDGDPIDLEVYQSLLVNKEEEKIGFLFMGRDETEKIARDKIIKQQVRDLNEKNRELKKYIESNIHLEQFAYLASHDLRTPIRTLVSFTQLLKRRTANIVGPEEKEYMEFIIRASKNMMNLVNDILSFSKVNTTKVQLEEIDMEDLLADLLEEMQVQIHEKKGKILIEELPKSLIADKTKMRQLFQNFISNALKFSKEDTNPLIQIGAERSEDEWVFWIKDNGIGIKAEYQKKIFLLFNRLHSDIDVEGFGIGLAICKKIVEQHEGEIGLESTFGEGSRFSFSIPVKFSDHLFVDENGNIQSRKA
ncbi:MAG: ATP-binding protein [Bacteroidota bacterium]